MSLQERRRDLLEKVATGDLSPDAAAKLLDALQRSTLDETEKDLVLQSMGSGHASPDEAIGLLLAEAASPTKTATAVSTREKVDAVRVVGTFRTLRVEGDPSVHAAVAEGPHEVRTRDGVMIFEEYSDPDEPGFVVFGPRFRRRIRGTVAFGGGKEFTIGQHVPSELRIRMNPDLPLEIDMTAGTARVRGVSGPVRATIAAGSARFEDIHSPFVAAVDAGSLNVRGKFDRGHSEIRCTAGRVRIELEKGSSVRVTARATLGKISLPEGKDWQGIGGGRREVTVGAGDGTLDIEATTGAAIVEEAKRRS
jgi:hypothetical protein